MSEQTNNAVLDEIQAFLIDAGIHCNTYADIPEALADAFFIAKNPVSRPAADESAKPVAGLVLNEAQMEKIAHDCETECHAVPGTNMWQCAYMAIQATLAAISVAHNHTHIAEVCEDGDGFKHIESAIEDLDDIPAGTKLYAHHATVASKEAVTLSDADIQRIAEETMGSFVNVRDEFTKGLLQTFARAALKAQRDASKAE